MPLYAPNITPALWDEVQAGQVEDIYRRAAAQDAKAAQAVRPTYNEIPAGVVHLPRAPKVPFFTPAALVVGMARLK